MAPATGAGGDIKVQPVRHARLSYGCRCRCRAGGTVAPGSTPKAPDPRCRHQCRCGPEPRPDRSGAVGGRGSNRHAGWTAGTATKGLQSSCRPESPGFPSGRERPASLQLPERRAIHEVLSFRATLRTLYNQGDHRVAMPSGRRAIGATPPPCPCCVKRSGIRTQPLCGRRRRRSIASVDDPAQPRKRRLSPSPRPAGLLAPDRSAFPGFRDRCASAFHPADRSKTAAHR